MFISPDYSINNYFKTNANETQNVLAKISRSMGG